MSYMPTACCLHPDTPLFHTSTSLLTRMKMSKLEGRCRLQGSWQALQA